MSKSCLISFLLGVTFVFNGTMARAGGTIVARASSPSPNLQGDPTQLKIGQRITQPITKGQFYNFTFDVGTSDLAELTLEWDGIDLNCSIYDSAGIQVTPFAASVSAPGPVSVVIKAEKAGPYRLEVTTPVRQKILGTFSVRLETVRPATLGDEGRITTQNLMFAALKSNSPSEAIKKYAEALQQWNDQQNSQNEAQTLVLIGNAYKAIRGDPQNAKANFESAADSYKKAAAIWRQTGYKKGEAYATLSLAQLFRSGPINESLPIYKQAELLFAQIPDPRGQADALYGRAFALMLISRTAEALSLLQQALPLRRALEDQMGQLSILNMMADAHLKLGDSDESLAVYDEALKAIEGLDNPLLQASLINGRALVTDDLGNWESAKLEYLRALGVIESLLGKPILDVCGSNPSSTNIPPCRSAALFLINLGEAYNSLGETETAIKELSKSLTINDVLGQAVRQAEVRQHLGYSYFLLGDTDKALQYYQEALTFQSQDPKETALTYTYLGMAHMAKNKLQLALEYYTKASPMLEQSGDKRALAINVDKLATAYSLSGNHNEAKKEYAKALDLWQQVKDPDGEALTLYNLAESERESGNLAAAIQNSEAAIKLVESLRTRITSEKFRVSYLADKQRYYEMAVDLNMTRGIASAENSLIASALEWNEMSRARTLLEAVNQSFLEHHVDKHIAKPEMARLLQQRNDLISRLTTKAQARTHLLTETKTDQSIDLINKDIDVLTIKLKDLDAQIEHEAPQLSKILQPHPSTVSQIQQQLDPDTQLLEFALGEKRSYAWVVTSDKIQGFELAPRKDIEALATRLLQAVTERNRKIPNELSANTKIRWDKADKEYADTAAALSKLILTPLASALQRERLVVVADGALQLVPFALLPDPSASAQLIAKHEIVSLPSASVLALQRQELANRKPAPQGVAVVADPVFELQDPRIAEAKKAHKNKNTPPVATLPTKPQNETLISALRSVGADEKLYRLVMSRVEAAEIERVVPKNDLFEALDFQANRAVVMSGALSKYRYVHLATHGVINLEHPELSGVVFSTVDETGKEQDGYVRLYEIYNLNLPAELVVLSACQTGVGKQIRGEGLMALTRGFMYAGAARVVASLWKVDDSATATLMAQFYKEMFTNGKKPAAALHAAQVYMSQQKPWKSPYYWAGFVLQGEWR